MAASPNAPRIRVGPAGWSYADWNGIVYPARRPRGFREASFLAEFFSTIEINTTFYHPARAEMARSWVERVEHNPEFRFTAKLWQRFTHGRNADREDEKAVKAGLEPLASAGRLGALLMQFPWSFKNTTENREYLGGVCMQFMEYPLVLEVRHSSWSRPEVFQMLADLGVGFSNIDQPVIGRSLAPSDRSTSPVGYVRLHGRNYEHWFGENEHPGERYDYLYRLDELEPWVERIRNVAAHSDVTYVITNNHFEGKAVANALELKSLLGGEAVRVPETMLARYPELAGIRTPDASASQPQQADLLFEAPLAEKPLAAKKNV
jgi:uncharacterized protein YecE (DUF72 family)